MFEQLAVMLPQAGLIFNCIGAIVLAKPLLRSKELIDRLSSYEDSRAILDVGTVKKTNEHLKGSLEKDNIFGIIGIALLFFGFLAQFFSLLFF